METTITLPCAIILAVWFTVGAALATLMLTIWLLERERKGVWDLVFIIGCFLLGPLVVLGGLGVWLVERGRK